MEHRWDWFLIISGTENQENQSLKRDEAMSMNGSNQFTSLDEYKEYLDIVAESNKKVGDACWLYFTTNICGLH
jgi:hypothetical protein